QNDVPVVLATDDPGVSRGDLTTEFQRAVEEHALTYAEIKRAARNSIQYSFLEGASLWKDAKYTSVVDACAKESKECTAFLDANPKAREQWRLEKRSANSKQVFRSAAAMPPLWVACLGCEVAGSRGEPGRRTYSPPILLSRKTGGL
ncbi:MAG TPA: hypothetical protein VMU84_05960, partial [Thermoanaerobaculia bacterium]|nr:hypothetical protein [Thermoanaerobaculia bacterium]